MFAQKHYPANILPESLDAYLEKGWFRMNQTIFVTHFLQYDMQFYSAVWLRYRLDLMPWQFLEKKLRNLPQRFVLQYGAWEYCKAQEELYDRYLSSVTLEMSPTLNALLLNGHTENVFNTRQIQLYDQGQLIALGIYDEGQKSAAGITNIYDPLYKKYSLGKMLMYLKMRECMSRGIKYFYPGYALPGCQRFQYKLQIAPVQTEYYCLRNQQWLPLPASGQVPDYLAQMEKALSLLQEYLYTQGIASSLMHYGHFDAALIQPAPQPLLDYPVFLQLAYESAGLRWLLAVHSLSDGCYRLFICRTRQRFGLYRQNDKSVCADLLEVEQEISDPLSQEEVAARCWFLK